MLKAGKEMEEMEKLNNKIKELEETLVKEEGNKKELEKQVRKLSFFKNLNWIFVFEKVETQL